MFPIGVFPFVMIGATLIFFSETFHEKCIQFISKLFRIKKQSYKPNRQYSVRYKKLTTYFIIIFASVQLMLPFRYLLYPGELFWTEQGYRFSWRVMLIEKAGYAEFSIQDNGKTGHLIVDNANYLTPQQEKMMATQPDMILQYAHFLRDEFKDSTWQENKSEIMLSNPIVKVDAFVSLFNEGSQPFIDPNVNLAAQKRGWHHKTWIFRS